MNKPDHEGTYSVGNSVDIIDIINAVKPYFVDWLNEKDYQMNAEIEVFQQSINSKNNVNII